MKSTAAKEVVQVIERRKELKVNLSVLRRSLEDEDREDWLRDVAHDTAQRQATIDALASDQAYTAAEERQLEKGEAMFAEYDGSSATVTQLKRSGTIARSETKLDEAGCLLLGRAEAEVRISPHAFVAYSLNYDGRHIQSNYDPAIDAIFPRMLARVNDHHIIVFNRKRPGSGLHDRTFVNSLIAKKVAEHPQTYIMVAIPIPSHPKITAKDEAGAVRAENFRSFRMTEVAPGRTRLEYVCSLDLRGSIPQFVTNIIAIPQQVKPPPFGNSPVLVLYTCARPFPTEATSARNELWG
jgi:hypothetical protein